MRIMIVGASTNPRKFGNKAVRAYLEQNHTVLPVNPNAEQVAGLETWSDVAAVPGPIDRASMYVPADVGIDIVDQLADRGDVGEIWLNPGSESDELIERAKQRGLSVVQACSIRDIDADPSRL